jgi:hypothetical protein
MRRRIAGFLAVLVLSLVFGSRHLNAEWCSPSLTNCGTKCIVFGQFAGYCNPPAELTTGCIQLYGPDCASMENANCCRGLGGGGF